MTQIHIHLPARRSIKLRDATPSVSSLSAELSTLLAQKREASKIDNQGYSPVALKEVKARQEAKLQEIEARIVKVKAELSKMRDATPPKKPGAGGIQDPNFSWKVSPELPGGGDRYEIRRDGDEWSCRHGKTFLCRLDASEYKTKEDVLKYLKSRFKYKDAEQPRASNGQFGQGEANMASIEHGRKTREHSNKSTEHAKEREKHVAGSELHGKHAAASNAHAAAAAEHRLAEGKNSGAAQEYNKKKFQAKAENAQAQTKLAGRASEKAEQASAAAR